MHLRCPCVPIHQPSSTGPAVEPVPGRSGLLRTRTTSCGSCESVPSTCVASSSTPQGHVACRQAAGCLHTCTTHCLQVLTRHSCCESPSCGRGSVSSHVAQSGWAAPQSVAPTPPTQCTCLPWQQHTLQHSLAAITDALVSVATIGPHPSGHSTPTQFGRSGKTTVIVRPFTQASKSQVKHRPGRPPAQRDSGQGRLRVSACAHAGPLFPLCGCPINKSS